MVVCHHLGSLLLFYGAFTLTLILNLGPVLHTMACKAEDFGPDAGKLQQKFIDAVKGQEKRCWASFTSELANDMSKTIEIIEWIDKHNSQELVSNICDEKIIPGKSHDAIIAFTLLAILPEINQVQDAKTNSLLQRFVTRANQMLLLEEEGHITAGCRTTERRRKIARQVRNLLVTILECVGGCTEFPNILLGLEGQENAPFETTSALFFWFGYDRHGCARKDRGPTKIAPSELLKIFRTAEVFLKGKRTPLNKRITGRGGRPRRKRQTNSGMETTHERLGRAYLKKHSQYDEGYLLSLTNATELEQLVLQDMAGEDTVVPPASLPTVPGASLPTVPGAAGGASMDASKKVEGSTKPRAKRKHCKLASSTNKKPRVSKEEEQKAKASHEQELQILDRLISQLYNRAPKGAPAPDCRKSSKPNCKRSSKKRRQVKKGVSAANKKKPLTLQEATAIKWFHSEFDRFVKEGKLDLKTKKTPPEGAQVAPEDDQSPDVATYWTPPLPTGHKGGEKVKGDFNPSAVWYKVINHPFSPEFDSEMKEELNNMKFMRGEAGRKHSYVRVESPDKEVAKDINFVVGKKVNYKGDPDCSRLGEKLSRFARLLTGKITQLAKALYAAAGGSDDFKVTTDINLLHYVIGTIERATYAAHDDTCPQLCLDVVENGTSVEVMPGRYLPAREDMIVITVVLTTGGATELRITEVGSNKCILVVPLKSKSLIHIQGPGSQVGLKHAVEIAKGADISGDDYRVLVSMRMTINRAMNMGIFEEKLRKSLNAHTEAQLEKKTYDNYNMGRIIDGFKSYRSFEMYGPNKRSQTDTEKAAVDKAAAIDLSCYRHWFPNSTLSTGISAPNPVIEMEENWDELMRSCDAVKKMVLEKNCLLDRTIEARDGRVVPALFEIAGKLVYPGKLVSSSQLSQEAGLNHTDRQHKTMNPAPGRDHVWLINKRYRNEGVAYQKNAITEWKKEWLKDDGRQLQLFDLDDPKAEILFMGGGGAPVAPGMFTPTKESSRNDPGLFIMKGQSWKNKRKKKQKKQKKKRKHKALEEEEEEEEEEDEDVWDDARDDGHHNMNLVEVCRRRGVFSLFVPNTGYENDRTKDDGQAFHLGYQYIHHISFVLKERDELMEEFKEMPSLSQMYSRFALGWHFVLHLRPVFPRSSDWDHIRNLQEGRDGDVFQRIKSNPSNNDIVSQVYEHDLKEAKSLSPKMADRHWFINKVFETGLHHRLPLTPSKAPVRMGPKINLEELKHVTLFNNAAGGFRYLGHSLTIANATSKAVNWKNTKSALPNLDETERIAHGRAEAVVLPIQQLGHNCRLHPLPMSNIAMDGGFLFLRDHIRAKYPDKLPAIGRIKFDRGSEDEVRVLAEILFKVVLLTVNGRPNAYRIFRLSSYLRSKSKKDINSHDFPDLLDMAEYRAFVTGTVSFQQTLNMSSYQTSQHLQAFPSSVTKEIGNLDFFEKLSEEIEEGLSQFLKTPDAETDNCWDAASEWLSELFNDCCNDGKTGKLEWLSQKCLGYLDHLYESPFGTPKPEQVVSNFGSMRGHTYLVNGGVAKKFSQTLKQQVDNMPKWSNKELTVEGWERFTQSNGKVIVRNMISHKPFDASDAEHQFCTLSVRAGWSMPQNNFSVNPVLDKVQCHPLSLEPLPDVPYAPLGGEEAKRVVLKSVQAFLELVNNRASPLGIPEVCLKPGENN